MNITSAIRRLIGLAPKSVAPRDELLFLTHTPHAYQLGTVRDGLVVTRIVQVAPTALVTGGAAPCWEVYGTTITTTNTP